MVSLDENRRLNLKKLAYFLAGIFVLVALVGVFFSVDRAPDLSKVCPQPAIILPASKFKPSKEFFTEKYTKYSADLLSGAVQIPTVSYDDMDHDVSKEPRFKIFKKLHVYLFKKFPLAAAYVETVNTYGLLYTIPGSESSLKPVLYMAHQDVVPVNPETADKWDHDPFSGLFDGEWLHGRGSADTKNTLVGTLEAVEALLEQGWKPKRTVLLSYGFDEEIEGSRGAKMLAAEIHKRYGDNGVEVVIDEGPGIQEVGKGVLFGLPAVAEKGRADFNLTLSVPGGHSSISPDHTGIGMMAELITILEDHPFEPSLHDDNVMIEYFGCMARYTPGLDGRKRKALTSLNKKFYRERVLAELDSNPETRFFLRTSQAIDIIKGGVKINALPETVNMQMDHRITIDSSVEAVGQRLLDLATEVAEKYDLSLIYGGKTHLDGSYGKLEINSFETLEPAPISVHAGEVWDTVAGTTSHIFGKVMPGHKDVSTVVLAPIIMTANTDTAHYWKVSDHIYRYTGSFIADLVDFHTVGEKLRFRSHLTAVAWYYEFLINMTV